MDPITAAILPLTLPATFAGFLSYFFQFIKLFLETRVRGFHPADPSHNDNLRLVYGGMCFLAALGWVLSTGGAPHTLAAGITLFAQLLMTATTMTAAAHILYQRLSGNASKVGSANSDPNGVYPPSDVDAGALLPTSSSEAPLLAPVIAPTDAPVTVSTTLVTDSDPGPFRQS